MRTADIALTAPTPAKTGPGLAPTVTLVIPAKNEAENIPHVFPGVPDVVDEVILVTGSWDDPSVQAARTCRSDVRVVIQNGRGKGDALRCGFAAARGDIIVMADADGSTDLSEIPRFLESLLAGAQFVKGSRYLTGGGSADLTLMRRWGNTILSGTVNVLFGTGYTDLCYGYNAFWSYCLDRLVVDCDGFEVETLLNVRAAKAGLRVSEVPSFERCRLHGTSNLRPFRDGLRVLRTILRERFDTGLPSPAGFELSGSEIVAVRTAG